VYSAGAGVYSTGSGGGAGRDGAHADTLHSPRMDVDSSSASRTYASDPDGRTGALSQSESDNYPTGAKKRVNKYLDSDTSPRMAGNKRSKTTSDWQSEVEERPFEISARYISKLGDDVTCEWSLTDMYNADDHEYASTYGAGGTCVHSYRYDEETGQTCEENRIGWSDDEPSFAECPLASSSHGDGVDLTMTERHQARASMLAEQNSDSGTGAAPAGVPRLHSGSAGVYGDSGAAAPGMHGAPRVERVDSVPVRRLESDNSDGFDENDDSPTQDACDNMSESESETQMWSLPLGAAAPNTRTHLPASLRQNSGADKTDSDSGIAYHKATLEEHYDRDRALRPNTTQNQNPPSSDHSQSAIQSSQNTTQNSPNDSAVSTSTTAKVNSPTNVEVVASAYFAGDSIYYRDASLLISDLRQLYAPCALILIERMRHDSLLPPDMTQILNSWVLQGGQVQASQAHVYDSVNSLFGMQRASGKAWEGDCVPTEVTSNWALYVIEYKIMQIIASKPREIQRFAAFRSGGDAHEEREKLLPRVPKLHVFNAYELLMTDDRGLRLWQHKSEKFENDEILQRVLGMWNMFLNGYQVNTIASATTGSYVLHLQMEPIGAYVMQARLSYTFDFDPFAAYELRNVGFKRLALVRGEAADEFRTQIRTHRASARHKKATGDAAARNAHTHAGDKPADKSESESKPQIESMDTDDKVAGGITVTARETASKESMVKSTVESVLPRAEASSASSTGALRDGTASKQSMVKSTAESAVPRAEASSTPLTGALRDGTASKTSERQTFTTDKATATGRRETQPSSSVLSQGNLGQKMSGGGDGGERKQAASKQDFQITASVSDPTGIHASIQRVATVPLTGVDAQEMQEGALAHSSSTPAPIQRVATIPLEGMETQQPHGDVPASTSTRTPIQPVAATPLEDVASAQQPGEGTGAHSITHARTQRVGRTPSEGMSVRQPQGDVPTGTYAHAHTAAAPCKMFVLPGERELSKEAREAVSSSLTHISCKLTAHALSILERPLKHHTYTGTQHSSAQAWYDSEFYQYIGRYPDLGDADYAKASPKDREHALCASMYRSIHSLHRHLNRVRDTHRAFPIINLEPESEKQNLSRRLELFRFIQRTQVSRRELIVRQRTSVAAAAVEALRQKKATGRGVTSPRHPGTSPTESIRAQETAAATEIVELARRQVEAVAAEKLAMQEMLKAPQGDVEMYTASAPGQSETTACERADALRYLQVVSSVSGGMRDGHRQGDASEHASASVGSENAGSESEYRTGDDPKYNWGREREEGGAAEGKSKDMAQLRSESSQGSKQESKSESNKGPKQESKSESNQELECKSYRADVAEGPYRSFLTWVKDSSEQCSTYVDEMELRNVPQSFLWISETTQGLHSAMNLQALQKVCACVYVCVYVYRVCVYTNPLCTHAYICHQ
jgi:hypothetical protein